MEKLELVHRFYDDMLNRRKLELAEELLTPDVVLHGPEDRHGPEAVTAVDAFLRPAFPDLRFDVEDVLVQGEKAAIRWTMHATHTGEFLGIAPTGRTIALRANVFFAFRGDRIAELWPVIDIAGLRGQLDQ
ncbi:ester cyclase [Amycolatopsis acidicola]|uniref:Ester cyclase n=1 Tax=Amycolatopsis acidicola TaxID=2596893 RepID=A0A5N0UUT0_9PSEU|nr:ester cyclase [Amycolatopsis acidicola]KAA9154185.1 ester cyclase [Amycolatopsis acidicola]